jgi:pectin methylesterase-like acyl-CoA thioesterase
MMIGIFKRLLVISLLVYWIGGLISAGLQTAHADNDAPEKGRLVVAAGGPFTSIQAALDAAEDGDTIEVRGGVYEGPLVVDKSVHLLGLEWPVIDGRGIGAVVKLTAPDITVAMNPTATTQAWRSRRHAPSSKVIGWKRCCSASMSPMARIQSCAATTSLAKPSMTWDGKAMGFACGTALGS